MDIQKLAKDVLYNKECPRWLYEIENGATTVWETWDAIRTDGKPTKVSYNHYAFGCVGDCMYRNILGIRRKEIGYKSFKLCPNMGFNILNASGELLTVNGKISFSWKLEKDNLCIYTIIVPTNTTADVYFPGITKKWVEVNGIIEKCRKGDLYSWLTLKAVHM